MKSCVCTVFTCNSVSSSNQQKYACGQIEIPTQGNLDEQCPWEDICLGNTNTFICTHLYTLSVALDKRICQINRCLCVLQIFWWKRRGWVTKQPCICVSSALQSVWLDIQAWSLLQQRCKQGWRANPEPPGPMLPTQTMTTTTITQYVSIVCHCTVLFYYQYYLIQVVKTLVHSPTLSLVSAISPLP